MSGDPDLDSPSDRARAATDGELFEPFSPVHYAHKEADGHYERVSGISGGSARVSTHSRKISGGSEPGGDPPARRRSCTDPRDAAAAARLARGSPPRALGRLNFGEAAAAVCRAAAAAAATACGGGRPSSAARGSPTAAGRAGASASRPPSSARRIRAASRGAPPSPPCRRGGAGVERAPAASAAARRRSVARRRGGCSLRRGSSAIGSGGISEALAAATARASPHAARQASGAHLLDHDHDGHDDLASPHGERATDVSAAAAQRLLKPTLNIDIGASSRSLGGGLPTSGALVSPEPGSVVELKLEDCLGDLTRQFPWEEIEYNRCALQLSTETGLDEIHSLFSFMSMGQVWITYGGQLQGVVTDRALIEACLPGNEERAAAADALADGGYAPAPASAARRAWRRSAPRRIRRARGMCTRCCNISTLAPCSPTPYA